MNLEKYFKDGILMTLKSDAAVHETKQCIPCFNLPKHLGNFTHAWTRIDVKGDPLWAEA